MIFFFYFVFDILFNKFLNGGLSLVLIFKILRYIYFYIKFYAIWFLLNLVLFNCSHHRFLIDLILCLVLTNGGWVFSFYFFYFQRWGPSSGKAKSLASWREQNEGFQLNAMVMIMGCCVWFLARAWLWTSWGIHLVMPRVQT